MSSEALFQRFVEMSPVTVMLRATLENAFSPQAVDAIFADTARQQYEGELLFSSVVDLLALVVWRQKKSVGEAYKHAQEKFEVSVRSVYNKLNGTEMAVCRELVRRPAQQLSEVVDSLHVRLATFDREEHFGVGAILPRKHEHRAVDNLVMALGQLGRIESINRRWQEPQARVA